MKEIKIYNYSENGINEIITYKDLWDSVRIVTRDELKLLNIFIIKQEESKPNAH